jgi:addiction module RelE/StbE family toxin
MELRLSKQATKFISKLPSKQARHISSKLIQLKANPYPHDSKKLRGKLNQYYRANIGEYRIAYHVEGDSIIVPIVSKRNDGEIYKLLGRKV